MILISYEAGCRNCLNGDGIRHMYSLMDGNENEYQNKTEFEVMLFVEKWRIEDKHTCEFCGSANVEVLDIEINDYMLYDYERLVARCKKQGEYMLQVNIDKTDSQIDVDMGGSQRFEQNFLKAAITKIVNTISSRPNNHFKSHDDGNFFICLTGGTNVINDSIIVRLETFRYAGVTKEEALNAIKLLADQVGVSVDMHSNQSSLNTSNINFIFKSSDHLRYENGKHISGPHGGAGRVVKVEPNVNSEGYIVTLYNLDGNHPLWQNNIQMAPKRMKILQQSPEKIVLRGYGYDALGNSFADYGLTINLKNGVIEDCVLHMYDRGVDIKYLP